MKLSPVRGKSLRADAAWALYQILEHGISSRECMPLVAEKYTQSRDRNWLNEVVMGVLRTLPSLQVWLRPMLKKPLKGDKKIVEHLLMVGIYQLQFMRVSSHAAINETVEACKTLNAIGLRGLVNAILRQFQRQDTPVIDNPAILSGMPGWIYKKLVASYPEQHADIIQKMNAKPPIWLRVNTLKTSKSEFIQQLDDSRVAYTLSSAHPDAVIIEGGDITALPGFEDGAFAVQDGAAQMAAYLLAPENTDTLLDCCAAPGGKTCHIFANAPQSRISALDFDAKRLKRVEENMQRLGVTANIICGDASQPDAWHSGEKYDRILLDAPCSATGVIRRHPDIRWLRKASDINALVSLQAQILDSIWELLKPGGTLLYATCSILPEENAQQIDAFLKRNSNAQQPNYSRQILPGEEQMDGFYYARLIKSESP